MIFIDFPITGELRFIVMIFEWIFSIICLEFGVLFLFNRKKEKDKLNSSQDIGCVFLFFALSISSVISVLGSYFSYSGIVIEIHHFVSYIFLLLGFLLFIFVKEKQRNYFFKPYFFSNSLSVLLILFILFYILNNQLIIIESFAFLTLIFIFFILYFMEFIKKAKIGNSLFIKIMTPIFPLSLLLTGLFLTSDYSSDLLQIEFRLIGSLMQLFGIASLGYFFLKFPTFSEFEWKDKIEEVFLINRNGACIFYKSYIQKLDLLNKHLITSAITSVNIMLKEILKPGSREVSMIKKKGKMVYIIPSDLITGVVFSKEESKTIEHYMKQLVIKVEQVYKNILMNWDGDLDIFNPIKDIYEEIFST